MNTHLQLLWNSVFAPEAAVDLAKQHPNTTNLAWTYVAALIVSTFLCDVAVSYVGRPFLGTTIEKAAAPFVWTDSLAGLTIVSIIASVLLLLGQQWFWQKFESDASALPAIDAAIIAGFALSLVMLIPTYVVNEITLNSHGAILFITFFLLAGIFLNYSTLYFSHALGMTKLKSFWLNVLFFFVMAIVFALLIISIANISSLILGAPFDSLFEIQDQTQ